MTASILTGISGSFDWIWESSWQAGLIVLAVLIVQTTLRRWLAPEWRYALWALVAVRLLLPGIPESESSVYNVIPPATEFTRTNLRNAMGFQGASINLLPPSAPHHATAGVSTVILSSSHRTFTWWQWIAVGWMLGAGWMLFRMALAAIRFRRTIRQSGQKPSEELTLLLSEAAATFRMRIPDAVQTPEIDSPAVTGLWHPLVVLPAGLEDRFSREEIKFLFLHELAHIRRGDLWTNFISGLLQALHWFNPLLWIAFRRARHDRETACDALVLATQDQEARTAYGRTLIKVLEELRTTVRPASLVGILEGRSQLRQRLLQIAGYGKPTKLAAVVGILLIVALAATMLTKAASEKEKKAPLATGNEKGASQNMARLLAAASAGDNSQVYKIIKKSFESSPGIGVDGASALLNTAIRNRELTSFRTLLTQFRQTNLGKDWQPDDELLASLVQKGRTDFLDFLLAQNLDVKRLEALEKSSDAKMTAWIIRRTAETSKERADIKKLIDACLKGDIAVAQQLLDAGVDVNCRLGDGGWTPLSGAAAYKKLELVKLLLKRGALPDLPKYPGWDYTPLCLTGSVDVANVLKAAGADVHANLFGRKTSILTYAAKCNGAPMVQWFIDQGLDPKMIGDNDQTLLFGVKDAATAELLLKAGVDPNRPDEFGEVALQAARNSGVVKALIKGSAKVTGLKVPLLPSMIQMSSADAVEAVLEASGKPDGEILQQSLVAAAHLDKADTAEILIKYGAKANEPGEWAKGNMMPPLRVCCIFGSPKTAKVLLAHGADPNSGKQGELLKIAIHNGHKDVVEVLKAAGARGVSDLSYALATKDEKRVRELLDQAPDYRKQPEFWESVLPTAAERGDLTTVKAAIQKGVPVIVKTTGSAQDGYYSAAFEGQWEVLEFLLQQRDSKDDPSQLSPALQGAVWNCHPYENQRPVSDFEKCIKILLAAGASVQTTEHKDAQLVSSAVFSRSPGGNPRVIEMLVSAGADPNPTYSSGKHLSDEITSACKANGCSVPFEAVVEKVEKLANITINRG